MTHPPVTLPHLGRPARASTCTPVVRRTRLVHSSGRGQTLSVGTRTSRGMRGDGLAPRCDLLSRSLIRGVRRVLAPRGFRNSGLSTSPRLGPAAGGPRASDGIPGGGAVRRGGLRACVRVCVRVRACGRVRSVACMCAASVRQSARVHTHAHTCAQSPARAWPAVLAAAGLGGWRTCRLLPRAELNSKLSEVRGWTVAKRRKRRRDRRAVEGGRRREEERSA